MAPVAWLFSPFAYRRAHRPKTTRPGVPRRAENLMWLLSTRAVPDSSANLDEVAGRIAGPRETPTVTLGLWLGTTALLWTVAIRAGAITWRR